MTHTYWEVGRRIVEHEQHGKKRAVYGEALIERLALDLTGKFGRGFSQSNLTHIGGHPKVPDIVWTFG